MAADDFSGGRRATGSAALIRDESGRVLLVRRAYPPHDWVLPGGNAEAGEDPVATVVREVEEETGWRVVPLQLLGVYYQADHPAGEFLHFVVECHPGEGVLEPRPGEISEAAWFSAVELPEPMSESTQARILDAISTRAHSLPVVLPTPSDAPTTPPRGGGPSNAAYGPAAVLRVMLDALTTGDTSRSDEVIDPDYVDHQGIGHGGLVGRHGFEELVRAVATTYAESQVRIVSAVETGDCIAAVVAWASVTRDGTRVEKRTIEVLRVGDGLALEHWGAEITEG